MATNKFKRELEVAFSKHAQPLWLRVLKYTAIVCYFYFFWGTDWLWIVFSITMFLGLALHLWYRYKTKGWTKSFGGWDYEKNKEKWK